MDGERIPGNTKKAYNQTKNMSNALLTQLSSAGDAAGIANQFLNELEPSISRARLQRYRLASGSDLDTVVNYVWNVALAESLFCCLNAVEIALRNALHNTLTQHFGVPTWFDRRGLLEPVQVASVETVKRRIQAYGDPVAPDRVVSELTFGFWVVILSRNYATRLWQGQNAAPLKNAFLRIPRNKRRRQIIHQQYNEIRELRNRVFHYEPIFDDVDLMRRYGEVKRGLHWLNPRMVDVLEWQDRFPEVHAHGRAAIQARLEAELGMR
jgi:hypothetical protein